MADSIKVDVGFLGTALGAVTDGGQNVKVGARTERTLDKYEQMMKNGELIHGVQFAQGLKDKGLSRFEDDVEIFLPIEEILRGGKRAYLSVAHFSRLYTVEVIGVDREAKRVTVSFLKAQERVRPAILRQSLRKIGMPVMLRTFRSTQRSVMSLTVLLPVLIRGGVRMGLSNSSYHENSLSGMTPGRRLRSASLRGPVLL